MPFMNIILVKTPSHRFSTKTLQQETNKLFSTNTAESFCYYFYDFKHLPTYMSTLVPEEARRHLVPWN